MLHRRPVKVLEKPLFRLICLVDKEVRRSICSPRFQQSTPAHERAVFTDIDCKRHSTKEQILCFLVELVIDQEQIQGRHGKDAASASTLRRQHSRRMTMIWYVASSRATCRIRKRQIIVVKVIAFPIVQLRSRRSNWSIRKQVAKDFVAQF
jgi:hypothetical protein